VNFGNQAINTSSAVQNVTATNVGTMAYSIPTISITGTNAADFSQTNTCPTSLAVGAHCAVSVTFTPSATGSRTATLSVPTSSANTASLSGTGTNPSGVTVAFTSDNAAKADGSLADTLSSLAFPYAIAGSASAPKATSEPERVMVYNKNGGSLTFSSITYSGTNAGDFSTATTNCSGVLANNSGCYIWIIFSPSTTGSESANLNVAFTAGSAPAFSLSGTGQSGTIVSATCASIAALPAGPFGVPILAANTTYVLPTTTCNQMIFSPGIGNSSSNTVLQGNCASPNGANTIFDGQNAQNQIFPDGASVSNITLNFTIRCITVKRYGYNGNCPAVNNRAPQTVEFNTNTGWVITGSTIGPSCGIGIGLHGGSQTLSNDLVTGNSFEGLSPQGASGTQTLNGMEFTGNSQFQDGSTDCNVAGGGGNCASYKMAGAASLVETGGYHHDQLGYAAATWADVFSGNFTVTGDTMINIGSSCIRYETVTNPGTFTHNVCIAPGHGSLAPYQGAIIGDCGHAMTANNNYVTENLGFPAIGTGDDQRGGFGGAGDDCGGHSYTYSGTGNTVVVLTTGGAFAGGWRYGAGCINGSLGGNNCNPTTTLTSYSSTNNSFYTVNGASQAFIVQDMHNSPITLAAAQGAGEESGSTVASGTPTQAPSGCTGDGTFGIGCKGSGM